MDELKGVVRLYSQSSGRANSIWTVSYTHLLPYFIKILDMQEQYNAVIEQVEQNKLDKEEFRGFAF